MKGIVSLKEIGGLLLSKNIELKTIYIFGQEFRNNNKNLNYKYDNTTYFITQPILMASDVEMINVDFSFGYLKEKPLPNIFI